MHFYSALVDDWMGRHAEAEAELDMAARGPLPESKRLFVAAFRAGVQRRYAEAVTAYRAALERYPDDIYLAYGLFEALYHGGRGDDAIAAFRRLRELSPGFGTGVMHVFDRAIASRDAETLAWAIEVAATTGAAETAEIWRARERTMHGDYRGALAIAEPLAELRPAAGELAVAAHLLAGDIELARARAEQLVARGIDLELGLLAICTATGDEVGRRSSFDRERARIARTPATDHKTMAWIALLVHELPLGDPRHIAAVRDGIEASVSERFAGDLRVAMARVLLAGARGDADALAVARASPYEEVQQTALAFAAADDHRVAATHWGRAAALALDHRFLLLERWHEARELRALGDHEGVVSACAEIIRPASFDWSWGSTVGPCLAWTMEAEAARGDEAAAQHTRDRLSALRSRAQ